MRTKAYRLRVLACLAAFAGALAVSPGIAAQEAFEPARATRYADLAGLPDWGGVWTPDWSILYGEDEEQPAEPVLTPAAQERLDAFLADQKVRGVDQLKAAQCIPPGMPGIMRMPYPIEFLYTAGRVTIFLETYSQARRIYTDGRTQPEDPDPLFNGNSIGRWDGDTLVVDTIGFSPLTEIAPGIGHSQHMHIRERIWRAAPDRLWIETIITDPQVLAEPYVRRLAYRLEPDWDIREYVCAENNRLRSDEGGANIDLGLDGGDDPFGPPAE